MAARYRHPAAGAGGGPGHLEEEQEGQEKGGEGEKEAEEEDTPAEQPRRRWQGSALARRALGRQRQAAGGAAGGGGGVAEGATTQEVLEKVQNALGRRFIGSRRREIGKLVVRLFALLDAQEGARAEDEELCREATRCVTAACAKRVLELHVEETEQLLAALLRRLQTHRSQLLLVHELLRALAQVLYDVKPDFLVASTATQQLFPQMVEAALERIGPSQIDWDSARAATDLLANLYGALDSDTMAAIIRPSTTERVLTVLSETLEELSRSPTEGIVERVLASSLRATRMVLTPFTNTAGTGGTAGSTNRRAPPSGAGWPSARGPSSRNQQRQASASGTVLLDVSQWVARLAGPVAASLTVAFDICHSSSGSGSGSGAGAGTSAGAEPGPAPVAAAHADNNGGDTSGESGWRGQDRTPVGKGSWRRGAQQAKRATATATATAAPASHTQNAGDGSQHTPHSPRSLSSATAAAAAAADLDRWDKIADQALSLLAVLAEHNPNAVLPYWHHFLPSGLTSRQAGSGASSSSSSSVSSTIDRPEMETAKQWPVLLWALYGVRSSLRVSAVQTLIVMVRNSRLGHFVLHAQQPMHNDDGGGTAMRHVSANLGTRVAGHVLAVLQMWKSAVRVEPDAHTLVAWLQLGGVLLLELPRHGAFGSGPGAATLPQPPPGLLAQAESLYISALDSVMELVHALHGRQRSAEIESEALAVVAHACRQRPELLVRHDRVNALSHVVRQCCTSRQAEFRRGGAQMACALLEYRFEVHKKGHGRLVAMDVLARVLAQDVSPTLNDTEHTVRAACATCFEFLLNDDWHGMWTGEDPTPGTVAAVAAAVVVADTQPGAPEDQAALSTVDTARTMPNLPATWQRARRAATAVNSLLFRMCQDRVGAPRGAAIRAVGGIAVAALHYLNEDRDSSESRVEGGGRDDDGEESHHQMLVRHLRGALAQIRKLCTDSKLAVRVDALFALGNVFQGCAVELIPTVFGASDWRSLCGLALRGLEDSEKAWANSLRCLSFAAPPLSRIVRDGDEAVRTETGRLQDEICNELLAMVETTDRQRGRGSKFILNACMALQRILHVPREHLPPLTTATPSMWRQRALDALAWHLRVTENTKLRPRVAGALHACAHVAPPAELTAAAETCAHLLRTEQQDSETGALEDSTRALLQEVLRKHDEGVVAPAEQADEAIETGATLSGRKEVEPAPAATAAAAAAAATTTTTTTTTTTVGGGDGRDDDDDEDEM